METNEIHSQVNDIFDSWDIIDSVHDGICYYPNACHVCRCFGEKAVNLKRCSSCGMISYCSEEHQKKDWPSHKQFCKVLCQIKEEWGVDHLLQPFRIKYMSALNNIILNMSTHLRQESSEYFVSS